MNKENSRLIFIVEDDTFYREIVYNHICNREYLNVESYKSAEEFSENLYKNPEIIFLDYNLNSKNGLDLLKEIKSINPDTYVILMSAQDTIQVAVDSLRYGAIEYIIKNDVALEKIDSTLDTIYSLNKLIEKSQSQKNNLKKMLVVSITTILIVYLLLNHTI